MGKGGFRQRQKTTRRSAHRSSGLDRKFQPGRDRCADRPSSAGPTHRRCRSATKAREKFTTRFALGPCTGGRPHLLGCAEYRAVLCTNGAPSQSPGSRYAAHPGSTPTPRRSDPEGVESYESGAKLLADGTPTGFTNRGKPDPRGARNTATPGYEPEPLRGSPEFGRLSSNVSCQRPMATSAQHHAEREQKSSASPFGLGSDEERVRTSCPAAAAERRRTG